MPSLDINTIMLAVQDPTTKFANYYYTYISKAYYGIENLARILNTEYTELDKVVALITTQSITGIGHDDFITSADTARVRTTPSVLRSFNEVRLADVLVFFKDGNWYFRLQKSTDFIPYVYLDPPAIEDYLTTMNYLPLDIKKYSEVQVGDYLQPIGSTEVLVVDTVTISDTYGVALPRFTVYAIINNGQLPKFTLSSSASWGVQVINVTTPNAELRHIVYRFDR